MCRLLSACNDDMGLVSGASASRLREFAGYCGAVSMVFSRAASLCPHVREAVRIDIF